MPADKKRKGFNDKGRLTGNELARIKRIVQQYADTANAAYVNVDNNFSVDQTFLADIKLNGTAAIWTSGTGTPEGSITAVVGSMYTRTDGGASTTLYVKESGSGNTGWVAK